MQLLNQFGVNGPLLLAQIINFLIVFYILKKLLYKPFLAMLKKRETEVKLGLKQAEEGHLLLEETKAKEKEVLRKAEETAEKIVNDAKRESSEEGRQIEDNARQQALKILSEAESKIAQDTKEAEERLVSKIGRIAISVLEKTLPNILTKKDQEEVLKKAASQLE